MAEIDLITQYNKKSPVSEAYRAIRTNLQFCRRGKTVEINQLYVGNTLRREVANDRIQSSHRHGTE